jgi:cation diffusion facilitator CzcD-associated flavoprotein CzcO
MSEAEHFDVVIVGAGISGIGAAARLHKKLPRKQYAVLEAREDLGGTWDLFRYPGIRSDSDMFTLGYSDNPWRSTRAIVDGPSIKRYVREHAREHGVDRHIRYGHKVVRASFSRAASRWTLEVERSQRRGTVTFTCSFLWGCTGYYSYDEGYTPEFAGVEQYKGRLVHPQQWPEDLDYAGKRVVVIGSGATAVTLVPALAQEAGHVTMLQRSPSYLVARPLRDPIAGLLRRVLPTGIAYEAMRWTNASLTLAVYGLSRARPDIVRGMLRKGVEAQLPSDYDVDVHFNPSYNPWDQRLCVVPDGDLFRAIRHGQVDVVTDHIDRFTKTGLKLRSGAALDADIIITATGLNAAPLGGLGQALVVDDVPVDLPATMVYKGLMLSGVPNFAFVMGYTNASWTLKADLVFDYVCRLLRHVDKSGYSRFEPDRDPEVEVADFLPLSSGYVQRVKDRMPKQGATAPWKAPQNWFYDLAKLPRSDVREAMAFDKPAVPVRGPGSRRTSAARAAA